MWWWKIVISCPLCRSARCWRQWCQALRRTLKDDEEVVDDDDDGYDCDNNDDDDENENDDDDDNDGDDALWRW